MQQQVDWPKHVISWVDGWQGKSVSSPLSSNCTGGFIALARVEGWRGKSVSSPRRFKLYMRISRIQLSYTLLAKPYVAYRAGSAFVNGCGLRT